MADASQALLGIGAGLTQSSQTLANAARLRQEEQLYNVKLQELQAQRDERVYGQALQRVQMGINLPETNKNDYFLKGPGRKYINTVLGGEATDDVIKVFTSNKTREKTEQVLTYLPELMKDPSKLNEVTNKIKGAISDPALAYDAINTLADMVAKSQQSQKTTAEINKLTTEAQSPFGDPKFAYKQGFDQAKAEKDRAESYLGEYRKQLGQRQQANREDPRIKSQAFQAELKKQALQAAGISEQQLSEFDRVSKTPYPELIKQFSGQTQQPIPVEPPVQPAGTEGDFGVLPTDSPLKQPSAADIKSLSEAESIPMQLKKLQEELPKFKEMFGPITGRAKGANPYDTKAQVFQSKIKELAQTYGKFKEGGVLRKEDVPKYEAIFPKLGDTYEVASGKLNNVLQSMEQQLKLNQELLQSGGYKVPRSQQQVTPSGVSSSVQNALDMVK